MSMIGSCKGGVDSPGCLSSKGASVRDPVKTSEKEATPSSSHPPSHGPIRLEDFEVQAVLGRGGYGKVLHVYNAKTHCYYAMKVLKKDELLLRRQVSRTKVERLILERANFPFITRLYYAYQTPYRLYLVMDFMQCGDLFTHLSRFGVFSEDRTRLYMAEIVLALEHLHDMGIIFVRTGGRNDV